VNANSEHWLGLYGDAAFGAAEWTAEHTKNVKSKTSADLMNAVKVKAAALDLSDNDASGHVALAAKCFGEAACGQTHIKWLTRVMLHRAQLGLVSKVKVHVYKAPGTTELTTLNLLVDCGKTSCPAPYYQLRLPLKPDVKMWEVVKGKRDPKPHLDGCYSTQA
jgi:hypothetical protein